MAKLSTFNFSWENHAFIPGSPMAKWEQVEIAVLQS